MLILKYHDRMGWSREQTELIDQTVWLPDDNLFFFSLFKFSTLSYVSFYLSKAW
jgi:hypothetical protein